jgi:uncharacterized protein (DUF983 family)
MSSVFRCLAAILLQRCPKCWQGSVFHGLIAMNERCPVCGHKFQQDGGYFLGAMYVSYGLSIGTLVLLTLLIHWLLLPGWSLESVVLVALVPYLLFVPAVFRYSRILWMFFDLG